MDKTSITFLEILKAALKGGRAAPDREITPDEWQALFRMAGIHKVLPLVFEAVYTSDALRGADLPWIVTVRRQVLQQVMLQTMRTSEFLALNQKLQAAGVTPLVVKGIICRELYPKPDYRQSSDEDVLIRPEQFAAAHQVLLDFGMHTTEREPEAVFEVPYRKDGSPLYIELHKHLFSPESEAYGEMNGFFEDAFENAAPEEIQGSRVCTLGHTDHLLYLICHAFKHFLYSGFGIRQVCDIILYANAYGSRVDWERILNCCRAIRADRFAASIFRIGEKYLVFDPGKAAYPKAWRKIRVDELPMLEDLLSGGVYGGAELSRRHSSNITLDAVAAEKQGRKARHGALASLFPPAARLAGRYPYLRKRPYLLPLAWLSRLWDYLWASRRSKDHDAARALKIGSERIRLMKHYGILK